MAARIKVTSVLMSRDNDGVVIVSFEDGHRMTFVEHHEHLRAATDTLQSVFLETRGKTLVVFNSRHQYPVHRSPLGFALASEGWTPQRFASYWKAVLDYVDAAQRDGQLRRAARVMNMGRTDLKEIQNGEWQMPPVQRPRLATRGAVILPPGLRRRPPG